MSCSFTKDIGEAVGFGADVLLDVEVEGIDRRAPGEVGAIGIGDGRIGVDLACFVHADVTEKETHTLARNALPE